MYVWGTHRDSKRERKEDWESMLIRCLSCDHGGEVGVVLTTNLLTIFGGLLRHKKPEATVTHSGTIRVCIASGLISAF